MNACAGVLATGERRGQVCGKRGVALINGAWYCGIHRSSNPWAPPPLCLYDPPFPLAHPDSYVPVEDPEGEERVASLGGYINIRVGAPLLNGETVPLALISSVSPGTQGFSKASLAAELASAIKEIAERPDVYRLGCTSLDGLRLEKITYDTTYNIFIAHLSSGP